MTYLAVDEDRLGTRCVIKQFLPNFEGSGSRKQASIDKAIELFNQEALRLCELGEHRQIPTLLAFFEEDTRLYLVQEFIDGLSLWQELQERGAFSEKKVQQVLSSMLPVLKFIHTHRVIHRDITPTNILRRQRDGQLMLIDFGVAKLITTQSLMQTGTKIGTQGYAPLEQMRSGKAFPASDIYSLGVTCLHLLTNINPERLYDPLQGWTWREQLTKQGKTIGNRLGQVLDKMVQDMVRDRYQSVDEVLRDLDFSPPISAPAPSPPPPLGTRPQKTQNLASVSAATVPLSVSKPKSRGWRCIHTLKGHTSWVTSVAISSNNLVVASGSLDDTIKVWNLQTGELLGTLFGHLNAVNAVAITPDNLKLASCSDDGNIKIWDLPKGQLLATLVGHLRDITSVAISPDGKLLASGSEDRTIKLWDLSSNLHSEQMISPQKTLSGWSGIVKAVVFSPDGKYLATGGLDNNIHLWNLADSSLAGTISGHNNSINAIAISPDSKILASASKDQSVKLWRLTPNVKNGAIASEICTLTGHFGMVNCVTFSPQGSTLISGGNDKNIKLWQVSTGKLLGTVSGHLGAVNSIAITSDGKTLVSGSWDKTVKVWRWFP